MNGPYRENANMRTLHTLGRKELEHAVALYLDESEGVEVSNDAQVEFRVTLTTGDSVLIAEVEKIEADVSWGEPR